MTFSKLGAEIWRNYDTDGVPSSGAHKVSKSDMRAWMANAETFREVLAGNRILYVRPDGNDSNTGLANTSGAALLTIQAAWNKAAALDAGGKSVVIQVADGTYTDGLIASGPVLNAGNIYIWGNTATPANVIISSTATCMLFQYGVRITEISGFKLQSSAGSAVHVRDGANVIIGAVNFGSAAVDHVRTENFATTLMSANYTVSGGAALNHLHVLGPGSNVASDNITVTITGTPTFTRWCGVAQGYASFVNTVFSGSITGAKYYTHYAGVINLGGATVLPGSGVNRKGGLVDDYGDLQGVIDASDAAAGVVGEIIWQQVVVGSAVALTTATSQTITSISLTAGDWDVSAVALLTGGATTTIAHFIASISGTAATLDTTPGSASYVYLAGAAPFSLNSVSNPLPPVRVSISSTTTIYLVVNVNFGVSTCSAYGRLRARRVR